MHNLDFTITKAVLQTDCGIGTGGIEKRLTLKRKTMIWWSVFGVAITFLTLIVAGAFKKKNENKN